jgi:hypothetical protein
VGWVGGDGKACFEVTEGLFKNDWDKFTYEKIKNKQER